MRSWYWVDCVALILTREKWTWVVGCGGCAGDCTSVCEDREGRHLVFVDQRGTGGKEQAAVGRSSRQSA
jgi:hypothetical protein